MTKRKQPKTATYEGIHTCSKGCKKPGCSRGLRDEIESLKAELERLKKTDPESVTDIDIQADPAWAIGVFRFHRQNYLIEIERLKRGADGIIRNTCRYLSPFHAPQVLKEWHELKEGKPAV